MPVTDAEKKAYVAAKIAEARQRKGKASLPQVIKKPYDPENAMLSKSEFVEKRRKKAEAEMAARRYVDNISEADEATEEAAKEEKPRPVGRPKKVD